MLNKISEEIKSSLKSGNKQRLLVLRSLKSAIRNFEIDSRKEATEEDCISILKSEEKKRKQAIELYLKGNRKELADKEQFEIDVIREFLPKPLSVQELEKEVENQITELDAKSMKDMGIVMKSLSARLGSRADGKTLSNIVKNKLSNK